MYRRGPIRRDFGWADVFVLALLTFLIYALVALARQWANAPHINVAISLAPGTLPLYALFSFLRAITAYLISLVFSLVYGYAAAKLPQFERILISILDILQCVPVMGFLPGLVLGLGSLFPNSTLGPELACVISIFTSQAWNMTFSIHSSLKSIPTDLQDVSKVVGLSWWHRFTAVELPFSAIGLAWNSLMSMAGGWFFLAVCESFSLGDKVFRLPGIGSYMSVAIEQNNKAAMLYGVMAMALVIIIVDFVIWRPVMAWVRKFQMDQTPDEVLDLPFITNMLRESWLIRRIRSFFKRRRKIFTSRKIKIFEPKMVNSVENQNLLLQAQNHDHFKDKLKLFLSRINVKELFYRVGPIVVLAITIVGCIRLWEMVRVLSLHDWRKIWGSVGLTFVRVFIATVLSSLWTIPTAIYIGLSPRLTKIFQPIVQVVASFPAPMVYPIVITLMLNFGITLHWGSSLLMMLGVQWYILFNVLAGAMSVTRDLKDSMQLMNTSTMSKWFKLYLPAAFPGLVTGWITAAGGAWNASVVAEYIEFGGKTHMVAGIGAMISQASATANFPLLAGCLIAMVVTVVGLNQTFWRWLSELAETRFRFER